MRNTILVMHLDAESMPYKTVCPIPTKQIFRLDDLLFVRLEILEGDLYRVPRILAIVLEIRYRPASIHYSVVLFQISYEDSFNEPLMYHRRIWISRIDEIWTAGLVACALDSLVFGPRIPERYLI